MTFWKSTKIERGTTRDYEMRCRTASSSAESLIRGLLQRRWHGIASKSYLFLFLTTVQKLFDSASCLYKSAAQCEVENK
jgi:hypothetical protein